MTQDDIARVRGDLESIESAIGLPRWDPHEIRMNLLLAASGLTAAAWALIPHGLSPLLGLCSFAVPVIGWLRIAPTSEDKFAVRDVRSARRTVWLALPLIGLFAWCRIIGLGPAEFLGLAIFLIGVVLFSAAVGGKQACSLIGWAVALMIGGLGLSLDGAPVIAVLAGAIAAGGVISAAIAYAAREESPSHAAG
jgi:hypothetical protein